MHVLCIVYCLLAPWFSFSTEYKARSRIIEQSESCCRRSRMTQCALRNITKIYVPSPAQAHKGLLQGANLRSCESALVQKVICRGLYYMLWRNRKKIYSRLSYIAFCNSVGVRRWPNNKSE